MHSLQGPVVCPVVRAKLTDRSPIPVNSPVVKATRILRSGFWGINGIHSRQCHVAQRTRPQISKLITCTFSSSSNGNGSRAENFNENDADYVNSSVVEAGVPNFKCRNSFVYDLFFCIRRKLKVITNYLLVLEVIISHKFGVRNSSYLINNLIGGKI